LTNAFLGCIFAPLKKTIMKKIKKTSKLLILLLFLTYSSSFAQDINAHSDAQNSKTHDFKITTLNAEWLSCLTSGPKDRELQINNIVSLIKTMNSDLVALQEVGTSNFYNTIDTLVWRLGSGWEGIVVPWKANNCSQNQGIVYKKSKINLIDASLITNGGSYNDWSAGRFPAYYEVSFLVGNKQIPVAFINIHAKAYADATSYSRRKNASIGLKALLDKDFNTKRIVILGDFNDYLEGTICGTCGGISPYKNFMDDVINYKGVSAQLKTVDHFIISNELFSNYLDNSAFREYSATQTIPNYSSTTTDHIPTSVIFRVSDGLEIDDYSSSNSFQCYPNPTTGVFTIQSSKFKVQSVEIYDVIGKKISSHHLITSSSNQLDISHFISGVYILKITTEKGIVTQKIIKTH